MQRIIPILLLFAIGILILTSCIVDTRPRRTVVRERRACPGGYHWEGNDCVHNGRKHGKHKDKDKHDKHDRD